MERAHEAGFLVRRVKSVCIGYGLGVNRNDGIYLRPLRIVTLDPVDVRLYQLPRRQSAGFVCGMNIVNGRFHDLESRRLAAGICDDDSEGK